MGADDDAPAPAGPGGRDLPPPIPPPHFDSDAPAPGAPGEAARGGVAQDEVPLQAGLHLDGAGRQVLGDGQNGEVPDAARGGVAQDEVPLLPVAQHQAGLHLDGAGRQVLGDGQDGEVPDAARFAEAQRPGGDPAGGEVDLQAVPVQHAVGGADHVGERAAGDHQGVEAGGDGITADAIPPVGRSGNGVGAANQGLGAGRAALPPRGRGRGGEHPGAALPPRGRGRGGEHRRAPNVVELHGPGANRPDAKGRTVPRLDRKFESEDARTNAMNYELQKIYRQLQESKADAREADGMSGRKADRKAAVAITKEYEKGLNKAEGLRRRIARAGATPVDRPKDLSKDPLA